MSMNKTCPISNFTSDDVPAWMGNPKTAAQCNGDLAEVAPSKLREEPFWIHALLLPQRRLMSKPASSHSG
jgi:hypothetical protein